MGLGPSTKMTTLHHYNCPVTRQLAAAQDIDFCGIIVNGVSERYDDKLFTAARTGDIAGSMRAAGAIVTIDGWGNHHIDFVNVIEQLEKRGIATIGMSYIGQQGRLVCTNQYVGTIIDFNKNESGYESCIVGDNNLTTGDAYKAVGLLRHRLAKDGSRLVADKGTCLQRLVRKSYAVTSAQLGEETSFERGVLTVRRNIASGSIAFDSAIANVKVELIAPAARKQFVNSNLDFMPVACKAKGELGNGETRLFTGMTAMITGAELNGGFQPCNIGSSEGILAEQVKFGEAGTPGVDDFILHIDIGFHKGQAATYEGVRAAHRIADTILNELRHCLLDQDDAPYTQEEFYDIARCACPRVILVKVVSGLGNMYETAVFPQEPGGFLGGRCLMDTQNMPLVISPNECRDGAIHSLL